MPFYDLPPAKLAVYNPAERAPRDFDAFWKRTLREAARHDLAPQFKRVEEAIYQTVDVYDVTFNGFGGHPIKGWFIEPAGNTTKRPCIVTFIGYGGGRSLPVDHLFNATAGFANLVMDTRGQGCTWAPGDTPDPGLTGNQYPGFMTRGIESPESYYYRRVFIDGVRAVEAAAAHPRVDPRRIAVTGVSQGGGITLAVAGLVGQRIKLAMADVPFLCHYRRAATLIDNAPYNEIAAYLKTHRGRQEQVFQTLAYFDGMHFAPRINARTLVSVGLMDTICPPSTVYAAYNRIKAKKELRIYEFNNHEGGAMFQTVSRLEHARRYL